MNVEPARSQLEIEQISFTGGPAWKQNTTVYGYGLEDNETMYYPHPDLIDYNSYTPEADSAWDRLIGGWL